MLLAPPLFPAQVQPHRPLLPNTALAVPLLHKLAAGCVASAVPLALPHTPLTAAGVMVMLAVTSGAALWLALSAWVAATVHVPAVTAVTVLPATVQVAVVLLL